MKKIYLLISVFCLGTLTWAQGTDPTVLADTRQVASSSEATSVASATNTDGVSGYIKTDGGYSDWRMRLDQTPPAYVRERLKQGEYAYNHHRKSNQAPREWLPPGTWVYRDRHTGLIVQKCGCNNLESQGYITRERDHYVYCNKPPPPPCREYYETCKTTTTACTKMMYQTMLIMGPPTGTAPQLMPGNLSTQIFAPGGICWSGGIKVSSLGIGNGYGAAAAAAASTSTSAVATNNAAVGAGQGSTSGSSAGGGPSHSGS